MILSVLSDITNETGGGWPSPSASRAVRSAQDGYWTQAIRGARAASAAPDVAGDHARLVLAGLLVAHGDARAGSDLARQVIPWFHLDRVALVAAHLVMAAAGCRLGHPRLAAEAASRAESLATTTVTRHLRTPALCFLALASQQAGDVEAGRHHAIRAIRVAHTPLWRYHAHLTLAELTADTHPYDAMQAASTAERLAPTPDAAREAAAVGHRAFACLQVPAAPRGSTALPRVHLQLFDRPAIHCGAAVLDAGRHPRVLLTLTYLLTYPSRPLLHVAEQLLPEGGSSRVRHHDAPHRMARIRQDIQRARHLLGDPATVVCHGGLVTLGGHRRWSSDLHSAILEGCIPFHRLPPSLECDWLDLLRSLR